MYEELQIPRSPTPASKSGWLGAPVARDDKSIEVIQSLLTDLQHNLAVVLAFLHQRVGLARLFQREDFSDHGMEFAGCQPFGKLLPRGFHERAVRAQIRQPESVDACAFRVEKAGVELRGFAGGGAVDDDASEVAHAANTFRHVLAAEHFENRVDAFAARQIFDRLDIIALLVVDAVLQAELAHSRQLVVGRRSSVHFDAENLSDFDGGGADSAGDGMNQDAGAGGLVAGVNVGLDVGLTLDEPNRPSSRRSRR